MEAHTDSYPFRLSDFGRVVLVVDEVHTRLCLVDDDWGIWLQLGLDHHDLHFARADVDAREQMACALDSTGETA
jgi:hypothetical protein